MFRWRAPSFVDVFQRTECASRQMEAIEFGGPFPSLSGCLRFARNALQCGRARQSERLNMCRYFLEGSVIVERWWGQALCKNNLPFWIGRSPACTGLPHHLYGAYSNCDGIPQIPPTPRVPEMVYRDGFQQPRIPLTPLASLAATPFSCVASSRCCPDSATAAWTTQHVVSSDGVLEANHLPLAQQLVPELQRA